MPYSSVSRTAGQRQGAPWQSFANSLIQFISQVAASAPLGCGVAGWRAVLALASAGAVLGLLAGLAFAALNPPMPTSYAWVIRWPTSGITQAQFFARIHLGLANPSWCPSLQGTPARHVAAIPAKPSPDQQHVRGT
jgi:hypothetical protein